MTRTSKVLTRHDKNLQGEPRVRADSQLRVHVPPLAKIWAGCGGDNGQTGRLWLLSDLVWPLSCWRCCWSWKLCWWRHWRSRSYRSCLVFVRPESNLIALFAFVTNSVNNALETLLMWLWLMVLLYQKLFMSSLILKKLCWGLPLI